MRAAVLKIQFVYFTEESRVVVSMWSYILAATYDDHASNLRKYLERGDSETFKRKFQRAYLETTREWMKDLLDFWENDDTKQAIWISMNDNSGEMDDDEAIETAVDLRKFKIFKTIEWDMVKDWIRGDFDNASNSNEDLSSDNGSTNESDISDDDDDPGAHENSEMEDTEETDNHEDQDVSFNTEDDDDGDDDHVSKRMEMALSKL